MILGLHCFGVERRENVEIRAKAENPLSAFAVERVIKRELEKVS